jgi:hypothetical protein
MIVTQNSDFPTQVINWVLFLIELRVVVSNIGSEFINVTEINFGYQRMNKLQPLVPTSEAKLWSCGFIKINMKHGFGMASATGYSVQGLPQNSRYKEQNITDQ